MKGFTVGKIHLFLAVLTVAGSVMMQIPVHASPFGQGVFNADAPFGSLTSLAISLGDNVTMSLTPSGSQFTGSASHTLTITTNDVVGYRLYVYCPTSTDMTDGTNTIPTSSNGSPGPLSINTWGYNTDGSSDYTGMLSTPTLIKDANGPYTSGDDTTIKYGVLTDITKGAGDYSMGVVYTVAAKNL